jgi:hypothetical protein
MEASRKMELKDLHSMEWKIAINGLRAVAKKSIDIQAYM